MAERSYLPVTVDKSHLITIGERLYSESIELIRELVNNAYDADATLVEVSVSELEVVVKDNGSGMDREGLKQYFNIGSLEKLQSVKSKKYKRPLIGQFGIGKFASLAACRRFEVYTQKGSFAARVTFDKQAWASDQETWQLPLEILVPDPERGDGTTVSLLELTRRFRPEEVERRIVESVPLKTPNFKVVLNGRPLEPRKYQGRRIPILDGTRFGLVHGEIIIVPATSASIADLGIEVKVKGVTVRRELFGMESWGKAVARVKGDVNADFLPVTSDRSGFVTDSDEYQEFSNLMLRVMEEVKRVLGKLASERDDRKASRALKEALHRVYQALRLNPDFSPFGSLPEAEPGEGLGGAGAVSRPRRARETEISPEPSGEGEAGALSRENRPQVKRLTPGAIVKKLRIGRLGISTCLDHYGPDGPECFTEGTVIYINRDHPLFQRETGNARTHTMYVARLLTQEIALMKGPSHPRQAFEWQSKLLRDAFAGKPS